MNLNLHYSTRDNGAHHIWFSLFADKPDICKSIQTFHICVDLRNLRVGKQVSENAGTGYHAL